MYEKKTVRPGDDGNVPFPKKLTTIKDCPKELHYRWRGDFDEKIFEKTLAVVGSRMMNSYGKYAVETLVGPLAIAGVTIVSGFMYGVDSYAHEVCVEVEGHTIAVLPYGIERKPASYQTSLYEKVLDTGGVVMSEFDGEGSTAHWTFPRRNRIVAGLADAVLVIQAAEDSGSLITANYCIDNYRALLAVPGPIDSVVSEGTNNLIKEGLATAVTSVVDILKFFGLANSAGGRYIPSFDDTDEEKIYSLVRLENLNMDQISEKSGLDISTVGYKTMQMCLAGLLVQKDGRFYVSQS